MCVHYSLVLLFNTKFSGPNTTVWIIGSSIIKHASHHAVQQFGNLHLDLQKHNITVYWHGKSGMVWEDVEPTITNIIEQRGHPDWVMLHCGGSSIGTMPLLRLQKFIKLTVVNLQTILPNTRFIWSQILPRNYYRHMLSNIAGETARKRINKSLAPFIVKRKGACLKYPDLQQCSPKYYRDGVHLSDTAQNTFLKTIRAGLLNILHNNVKVYAKSHAE